MIFLYEKSIETQKIEEISENTIFKKAYDFLEKEQFKQALTAFNEMDQRYLFNSVTRVTFYF